MRDFFFTADTKFCTFTMCIFTMEYAFFNRMFLEKLNQRG